MFQTLADQLYQVCCTLDEISNRPLIPPFLCMYYKLVKEMYSAPLLMFSVLETGKFSTWAEKGFDL